MEHFFSLPVLYKGEERSFNGRLVTFAYSYKFCIIIDNREIVFERDDEQHFRVLDEDAGIITTDPELLNAIIRALDQLKH